MAATGTSTPHKKSFSVNDYLHDVAGESIELEEEDEQESQRLNMNMNMNSNRNASEDKKATPSRTSQRRQRGTPRSGLISPQLADTQSFVNGLLSPFSPLLEQQEKREDFLEFVSLQPCLKVSVVVRVLPCEEDAQRCLFPHVKAMNPLLHVPKSPHDMVVVKPSAFGKVIPSSFTMETARLVAQVAHISSEDWARLYEFHHVVWPSSQEGPQTDEFTSLDSLGRAVAQDALAKQQSSLLISIGQAPTCVGGTYDQKDCQLSKIISHCQRLMVPKAVATISMVELREGKDSFRDLLNRRNKHVSIRHVDMKGAILEGLSQIPIDEAHNYWPMQQNSTIVATISIWDNAVSHEMSREPDSQIAFVELSQSFDPNAKAQNRSSTMSLGLALRQLLRHTPLGHDPAIAFRESTVTKVLQRSLESSKIVLLASVSQLSQDYETTLTTLNFLRSLLVKSGKTASSPFPKQQTENGLETDETNTMADRLQEYAADETILQQIVADPRQRLAKIMKPSPSKNLDVDVETVPSIEEEYSPIDYMQGLDMDEPTWLSPAAMSRDEARRPSISVREEVQQDALVDANQQTIHDDWSMEEPNEDKIAYASFSESSRDESESPQSQSVTSPAEGQLFDDDYGEDVVDEKDRDDGCYSMEGTYPTNELFVPHDADLYSFDQSEGAPSDPDNARMFGLDDLYFDDQRCEETIGENVALEDEGPSIQLLEDSSQESNGLSSLVETEEIQSCVQQVQYYREENDEASEGRDYLGLRNDVSHEIIFANEVGDDNDSHQSGYEQPQMWSETQEIEDDQHDLDPSTPATWSEKLPVETCDTTGLFNQSVDESLISRESRRTVYCSGAKVTSEHTNAFNIIDDPTPRYGMRQDNRTRKHSAFEALSSLGPGQPSRQGRELSSGKNPRNDHSVENVKEGDLQNLEGAVDQIQNMQSALWRSSAESLARSSDALKTQRDEMKLLENERDVLESTVSALKDDIRRVSEEHDARLHRYEEELTVLEAKHQAALADKRALQRTLDVAKSVGNDTKSRVEQLERELEQSRQEVLSTQESYRSVLDSRTELQNGARALKLGFDELKSEKERVDRNHKTLEQSLASTDKENVMLVQAISSKEIECQKLLQRLKQRDQDQEQLEEKFRQVEADRRQESLDLEKVRFSLKSLQASLEVAETAKISAEEIQRKYKRRAKLLETELSERNRVYDDLLVDKRATQAQIRDLEQKLVFADDEARAQESSIGRLKEMCQNLEDKMNETGSDRTFWEEKTRQLNRTVEKLEEETRVLSNERDTIELKVQQLEERLSTGDDLARGEIDRLREKYLNSERQRQELESLLSQYKTEYYDEGQKKSREVVNYRRRVEELEHECRLARQRESETSSTKDSTISTLREEVDAYSASLESADKQRRNLEAEVQQAQAQLLAMTEQLERYRNELSKSREEADAARDQHSSQVAAHIHSLTGRIVELEEELMRVTQERDRSLKRLKEEDSRALVLSAELDNSRGELLAMQRDIYRLQSELSESESGKKEQEEKIATLKATMDTFQARAHAQFGALAEEHQDFTKTFDSLQRDREGFRERLRKAEIERDACIACLQEGRQKLSEVGKVGDFLEAGIFAGTLDGRRSLATNIPRRSASDLYLTDNSIDQLLALRAEEIASCLALSARAAIRVTQDENSSLRSRLNSFEEDKRIEVAAMKNRIRSIEEDLRGGSVFSRR